MMRLDDDAYILSPIPYLLLLRAKPPRLRLPSSWGIDTNRFASSIRGRAELLCSSAASRRTGGWRRRARTASSPPWIDACGQLYTIYKTFSSRTLQAPGSRGAGLCELLVDASKPTTT